IVGFVINCGENCHEFCQPTSLMISGVLVIENNRTLPYGELWAAQLSSINERKFTTYQRDQESGLDYALMRYSATFYGRFTSVDRGPVALEAPQTLNRYAYTL